MHTAEEYYFQLIFQEDLDSQHLAHIYLESKVNICLSESILVYSQMGVSQNNEKFVSF